MTVVLLASHTQLNPLTKFLIQLLATHCCCTGAAAAEAAGAPKGNTLLCTFTAAIAGLP